MEANQIKLGTNKPNHANLAHVKQSPRPEEIVAYEVDLILARGEDKDIYQKILVTKEFNKYLVAAVYCLGR